MAAQIVIPREVPRPEGSGFHLCRLSMREEYACSILSLSILATQILGKVFPARIHRLDESNPF